MMNRIRLLPEHVANQIAAGEVVERPASVVKELVENAVDARATRVTVDIQAGGRSLIRVTDDGEGMSRDDALLCLERHATSKIQRAEDLSAIRTMGFRGEALPSIASVSRLSLTTRERDNATPDGTQVIIHGGKIIEVKAAGTPPGTSLEVRQLFFNLPARRKFLRSEETESAHVQHYFTLAALAYPRVAFTLTRDQRIVWQLPAAPADAAPHAALKDRLRTLLGGDVPLLPLEFTAEIPLPGAPEEIAGAAIHSDRGIPNAKFKVWGFIGAPGVSRATREDQHLFVNCRPVENRGLNFALLEGYHTALMKGRYPVACLFVELDPADVDVNIHPSKREVKFHHERIVRQFVAQAVRQTLLEHHAQPTTQPARSAPLISPRPPGIERPAVVPVTPFQLEPPRPPTTPVLPNLPEDRSFKPSVTWPAPEPFVTPPPPQPAPSSPPASPLPPPTSPALPLLAVPLRLVGVIGRLYVVLESDRGLVLLDQHAAHERILFEQMLQRMEQGNAPAQRLLLPETVELSPRDAQFLRENLPALTRLGVGLSEFGERTFLLDALPPFVKVANARAFVLGLVDELKAAGHELNSHRLGEHTIAKTVCRHAVKANDPLMGEELENLVRDLRRCAMPYTCPHGRPTLIEMNYRELEKKFGRSP